MTSIVIIDDNIKQLDTIEKAIFDLNISDIQIQKYNDEDVFIKNLQSFSEYSIFFVDIVLNERTGIDIAKAINQYVKGSIVIFISNYLDKVVDIYDAHHYYFIYKPELEKRLPIALNKAIESLHQSKETLPISLKGKTVILYLTEICYLERQKHNTIIKDMNQSIITTDKLDDYMNKLPPYFIRCHRSYIVNAQKIKEVKRDQFTLIDGTCIPISRAYQKSSYESFQTFLMRVV